MPEISSSRIAFHVSLIPHPERGQTRTPQPSGPVKSIFQHTKVTKEIKSKALEFETFQSPTGGFHVSQIQHLSFKI